MPTTHLHPLPTPQLSRVGRALAFAQIIKETLSIIVLGLPLVRSAPLVLVAALPGVLLYGLHWHLALGRPDRRLAVAIWVFTLIDELWGLFLFEEFDSPTRAQVRMLHWSYFLGLGIILLALAELGWRWQRRKSAAKRNVRHQAVLSARQRQ
jgi:toxin CptA